jgi:hypothetical protein
MSNYPYLLDTILTLPTVAGSDPEAVAINALQEAVIAVETELGIKPSSPYSNVRVRLDILESRINFGVSPSIPNDGYVKSPLYIWNVPQSVTLSISDGYGAPTESRLDGSLYMRADGYANNDFYIRRDGYWVPIQTEEWVAAGDLSGNHLSQKVIGIRTKPLSVSLESVGATQDGYHLTWDNADGYWRAETGFIAGSDLAADSPRFGRTGQKVIRFQNRTFAATAPVGTNATDGSAIRWNNVQNQWEPQATPMIFIGFANVNDGYTTRTNISSNKAFQSPMSATTSKVGMVNLGSRSTGATTGTTDNYAAILGGDQATASSQFSLVVGGQINTASTGLYATVINGNGNTSNNTYAVVLDGYSNLSSAVNALVGNGGNNQANSTFSTVLNGLLNTITASNVYASILSGSSNTITGAAATYSVIIGGSGNTVSGQNVFLGTTTGANVQSNYGFIGTGINNTISTTSNHSAIVSGTTNAISAASSFAFIGAGNNITATGLYATILNATVATVNGLHSLVLNGNTNSVTATFSTVVNGNNNTISGNPAYATIVDGYSHTITGSGGFIGDGYTNVIGGIWSSILNGNTNTLNSRNSTILNGSSNIIDVTSAECTLLSGTSNNVTGTTNALISGNGNILLNSNNSYVFGTFNNIQSSSSKIIGSLNTIAAGGTLNRILGNSNTLGPTSVMNNIFGQSNSIGPISSTHDNTVIGSTNTVDGYGNSTVLGSNNIAVANYSLVEGQFGKSRLFGQHVHANSRFTAGQIGNAQFSRVILQGTSTSGAAIPLLLQDTAPISVTFQDGYSYDLQIRVLVVNTSPISPNPVVPARFVFDVLAHQEASFTTTIAVGSNGAALPQATINVASTAGFATSGSIFVNTSNGYQLVTYTNTTGTSFTGCSGGTGTMSTGGGVTSVGLVLDNVNATLITPNTSDDPTGATRTVGWTVSVTNFNTTIINQLLVTVDPELDATNYVRPTGTPSNRRAVATIEMREMTRL